MGLVTLLSLGLAIPLGIYSAVHQYSKFDYFFTSFAFAGASMPTFFFGIMMILIFSIVFKNLGLPYLPPGSASAVRDWTMPWFGTITAESTLDRALHLVLPVAVLTIISVAGWSRYIRSSMLEVLRQDYVRTARAKGLTEKVVINRHALRNALDPVRHSGGLYHSRPFRRRDHHRDHFLLAGDGTPVLRWRWASMITRWPWPSCSSSAVLTVIATLIRDILYTVLDPRIRVHITRGFRNG